jgi:saccharopine dehydrogenase-like NADP-dependent oxidoreductase
MRVLLVGAGTVGEAIAKVAADRDWLEHMLVTDYDLDRAKHVVDGSSHGGRYEAHQIDASSA